MSSGLRIPALLCVIGIALLPIRVCSETYDCRLPTPGISLVDVVGKLSDGLFYDENGQIVEAPGKRLIDSDAARAALFHHVRRVRPTIKISKTSQCNACGGRGGTNRQLVNKSMASLGDVKEGTICGACGGAGLLSEPVWVTVTHSDPLPRLWDSPLVIEFRGKLNSAVNGNADSQLEVAWRYLDGRGVGRDPNEARSWFTKAAMQGRREALAPLSKLFLDPDSRGFHDYSFGLALASASDPSLGRPVGDGFVLFRDAVPPDDSARSCLSRHIETLEAGFLSPRIMGSLASGSGLEQVFSQKGVRAFPPSGAFSPTAATPAKELFVRGVAKYLGLGEAAADRRAGMLWIEAAASRADADAILFLALHHDAGVYYEESKPTAWAFYSLARILDGDSPIGLARLGRLNESGVQTDWMGLPELLHGYMVKGKISTQIVAGLSDLSLYRSLESAPPAKASKTVPIHAVSPSENAEIRELARTALATKLKVLDLSQSDELICGKFKDRDGEAAYMVSGILSHSADSGAVLTVPFTACFRVSKGASGPELYYCSAGRFHHGMLRSGY